MMHLPFYIYTALFLLCLTACRDNANGHQSLPACLEDRANTDTLQDQHGIVSVNGGLVLINLTGHSQVLSPCNLPNSLLNNDKIIFSGYKKEVFPNERWAGAPFVLTSIKLAENN